MVFRIYLISRIHYTKLPIACTLCTKSTNLTSAASQALENLETLKTQNEPSKAKFKINSSRRRSSSLFQSTPGRLHQLNAQECRDLIGRNEQNLTIPLNKNIQTQIKSENFTPDIIVEANALASNTPIEDRLSIGQCQLTGAILAGVFDGHLGSSMSHLLSSRFLNFLALAFVPTHDLQSLLHDLRALERGSVNERLSEKDTENTGESLSEPKNDGEKLQLNKNTDPHPGEISKKTAPTSESSIGYRKIDETLRIQDRSTRRAINAALCRYFIRYNRPLNEEKAYIDSLKAARFKDKHNNELLPNIPLSLYIKYIEYIIAENEAKTELNPDSSESHLHYPKPEISSTSTFPADKNLLQLTFQNRETFTIQRLEHAFVLYDEYVLQLAQNEMDSLPDLESVNTDRTLNQKRNANESQSLTTTNGEPSSQSDSPGLPILNLGSAKIRSRLVRIKDQLVSSAKFLKNGDENSQNDSQIPRQGVAPPWVRSALSGSTACVVYIDFPTPLLETTEILPVTSSVSFANNQTPKHAIDENLPNNLSATNKENIANSHDILRENMANSPSDDPPVLYLANVGDSRAVLGSIGPNGEWITTKLSYKHYTDNTRETRRLRAEHPLDYERAWLTQGGRLLGFLTPTRAFGDAMLKWPLSRLARARKLYPRLNIYVPTHYTSPPYLTARPEVISHVLRPEDKFLVIATDGLWDFLHTRQVVKILGDRWMENYGNAPDEGYKSNSSQDESDTDPTSNSNEEEDIDHPVSNRDFRPSSHEDLESNTLKNSKLSQKSQVDDKNTNKEKQSYDEYYHNLSDQPTKPCNSATYLIENALGGYGRGSSHHTLVPQNTSYDKSHSPYGKGNLKIQAPTLDYFKIATLLNLPHEIRRDFRDDITCIVMYFNTPPNPISS